MSRMTDTKMWNVVAPLLQEEAERFGIRLSYADACDLIRVELECREATRKGWKPVNRMNGLQQAKRDKRKKKSQGVQG